MSFTYCSSQAIIWNAGAGVSSTIAASGAYIKQAADAAESFINDSLRIDFIDAYATLSDNTKYILEDTAAAFAAIRLVRYDMSGYTSRQEATTVLDVLTDNVNNNIRLLKEKPTTTFIKTPVTS